MTELDHESGPAFDAHDAPPSAGAALRATREAAGLAIEDVAQQLKLAPRQVRALEDDDYARLPGRTFVRGFVRNYARFLQLDPDEVLALLPGSDVAPALERPTITPSGRPMGELPADAPTRRSWTRWVIPLVLVAIIVTAGVYEFRRQQSEAQRASADRSPTAPVVPGTTAPAPGAGATLPNPLTSSTVPADTAAPGAPPAAPASATSAPPSPVQETATTAAPAAAPGAPESAAPPSTSPSEPQLVLTVKGRSWIQVKDRNGNTLIAQNAPAGSTQTVSGPLPLDVVIGDAPEVTMTFGGQPVDLSPFVRGTVARLSLK